MVNGDMWECDCQKYQSPQDIYEALCTMESGEEIGIIGQMFADISWDNQDYYYTAAGNRLREKWDELTGYDGDWKMELAVWQLDNGDTTDVVWLCMDNDDAAKALGFKKIFVDELLGGCKSQYEQAVDEYRERISEVKVWCYSEFQKEWATTWQELNPGGYMIKNTYGEFSGKLHKKASNFKLDEEQKLILEARAMLNAYDDFMFGLKSNQHLYEQQEQAYKNKVALLQGQYDKAVKALLQAANEQGLVLQLPCNLLQLEGGTIDNG